MNRLIIWFSCGAASAVACKVALNSPEILKNYDEIIIAYCKVQEEHKDNERFLKDCEKWFGQKIIVLMNETYDGSIYSVFEKQFFRTPAGSPCTRSLKKMVRAKFQRDDDTHVFGYTLEEQSRATLFEKNNPNLQCEWVLIDNHLTKTDCLAMVEKAGIDLPVMYKLGYEHNNCIGCVKGGMGYFNKIRKDFPVEFKRLADFEATKKYTILKEQYKDENGQMKSRPLYLKDLDPNRGNFKEEPKIECGIECEIAAQKFKIEQE